MVKRVSLVRRQAGASRRQFLDHWTGPHADIVQQLPGLRGMRLGVVEPPWTPPEALWDGVGELWFDTIDDAVAAFASEPFPDLLAHDRAKFLGAAQSCFVRERTVIAPPLSDYPER